MQLFLTSVSSGIEHIDYLKEHVNVMTKLVILPFAHHFDYLFCAEDVYKYYDRCPLNVDSIFWRTVKPFLDIGINPDRIVVINHFNDPIELIKYKLLDENAIIYFPGGFPENIVKIVRDLRLVETIKQCKIVVGESAGSMFWSRRFFVYPDQDYKKYKCYKGIGFIKDFVILPHYSQEAYNFTDIIKSTCKFKKFHKEKVFLVKDGGYVWYDSNKRKVIDYHDCVIV
jgi:peptidase E